MIYGLIIAAGNQKRFKNNTPKALVKINDKPLILNSIDKLKKYCDKVFVVCSYNNKEYFKFLGKDNIIVICSGYGSGDAIWRALKQIEYSKEDRVFIQWGDAIVNESLYQYLLDIEDDKCLIPCIKESNPYVQIVQATNNNVIALFSKYGDNISEGYHDMSLFLCNIEQLHKYLSEFVFKYFKDSYKHKHNNEFEFLDVFNDTNLKAHVIEIPNDLKTLSFNTIEELEEIKNIIGG